MDVMITEGARLLRAFLKNSNETVPDFSERSGIARHKVQRALNGQVASFDVDFAEAVEVATKGEVPVTAWSSSTLRPATEAERGRVHPRHRTADELHGAADEPRVDRSPEYAQTPAGAP